MGEILLVELVLHVQLGFVEVKGLALPTIFHLRVYLMFSHSKLFIWLLRAVDFLLYLIELRWLLCLNLNSVAVNPIYVFTAGGTCSLVTSA